MWTLERNMWISDRTEDLWHKIMELRQNVIIGKDIELLQKGGFEAQTWKTDRNVHLKQKKKIR